MVHDASALLSDAIRRISSRNDSSKARSLKAAVLVFQAQLDYSNGAFFFLREAAELRQMPDWLPQCNDASDRESSWNTHA